MVEKNYLDIPQEKFEFANTGDTQITDKKLVTKSMSYFADAFSRFRKNKASVFAAIVILLIVVLVKKSKRICKKSRGIRNRI